MMVSWFSEGGGGGLTPLKFQQKTTIPLSSSYFLSAYIAKTKNKFCTQGTSTNVQLQQHQGSHWCKEPVKLKLAGINRLPPIRAGVCEEIEHQATTGARWCLCSTRAGRSPPIRPCSPIPTVGRFGMGTEGGCTGGNTEKWTSCLSGKSRQIGDRGN